MRTFLAVFRGDEFKTARLIALSSDDELAQRTCRSILEDADFEPTDTPDPVMRALGAGRRRALVQIAEGGTK